MIILKWVLIIYAIGCVLSYAVLKLCDIIGDIPISPAARVLCIFTSWIPVIYAAKLTLSGTNVTKDPIPFVRKLSNAKMLEITLEDYWVKAVQSDSFDRDAKLPIKGSPLCKEYYHSNKQLNKLRKVVNCFGCPVHDIGFGCESDKGLWQQYSTISGTNAPRQDAAIRMAKLFESIYKDTLLGKR